MRLPAEHRLGRIEVDGDVGPRQMVVPDRIRLTDRLPPDRLLTCGNAGQPSSIVCSWGKFGLEDQRLADGLPSSVECVVGDAGELDRAFPQVADQVGVRTDALGAGRLGGARDLAPIHIEDVQRLTFDPLTPDQTEALADAMSTIGEHLCEHPEFLNPS